MERSANKNNAGGELTEESCAYGQSIFALIGHIGMPL
jgi:hypothetical protein